MSRVVQGPNGITKKYNSKSHKGVDIGWKGGENDNILAHSSGVVVTAVKGKKKDNSTTGTATYGNYIKIKHSNGYYTLYAHLHEVYVKVGQNVQKGAKIGYMGESGNTFGKHLHFEVRNTKDTRINPEPYLNNDLPNNKKVITYQVYDLDKNKWLPNVKVNTNEYAGNFGNPISAVYIDDLQYQVHDLIKNKWLPEVTGRQDYAGNIGNPIDGIKIKNATYRARTKEDGWLPWVSKADDTNDGYAGIYGHKIEAIQIKVD